MTLPATPAPEPALLPEAGPASPRRPIVDIARGVAVLAMIVYHTAWDLSELGLVATDVTGSPGWSLFARAIAASFLTLSGLGLVLAHSRGVRRDAFLRRLALLALAAAIITAATWFVFPASYIYFGILHNLAVSSVLALPFVRAPVALTVAVAAATLALPSVAAGPAFDPPLLSFLGLATTEPVTNDYVPVFPWTGFVLAGIAAGRLAAGWSGAGGLPIADGGRARRLLATIGRRSLLIYLLHQPLIFGALAGVKAVLGPDPVVEAVPFMRSCEASCGGASASATLCRASCTCTVAALRREGSWEAIRTGRPSPQQFSRASELAQDCLDAAR